ncbi:MAG TPA: Nramp family divalent metal transporter, partial [Thermogutta sp.]|nr:Nramp family divalent metal transporter [Thermogutta sp.]
MSDSNRPDVKTSGVTMAEAPVRLGEMLLRMGPGMIIAAAVVGSGELILTPRTGAEAGFTLLWIILLGCVTKVFVQVELGRYAIESGQTTLAAINRLPGPRWRVHWMLWYWVVMFVVSLAQLGGIAHGVGQALAIALPIDGSFRQLLKEQEEWDREAAQIRRELEASFEQPKGSGSARASSHRPRPMR